MPLAQLHRGAPTSTAEFFSQLFGRGDDGPETTLICHFALLFCWIGSLCSLLDHVEHALSIEAWSTNFCQQSVYECQCSQAPPAFLTLSTFSRPQWWLARRVRRFVSVHFSHSVAWWAHPLSAELVTQVKTRRSQRPGRLEWKWRTVEI